MRLALIGEPGAARARKVADSPNASAFRSCRWVMTSCDASRTPAAHCTATSPTWHELAPGKEDVPDDVSLRRVAGRAGGGRADDARRDTIERRLRSFRTETVPVLDLHRQHGILTTVDGTQPRDEVTESIIRAIQPGVASAEPPSPPGVHA